MADWTRADIINLLIAIGTLLAAILTGGLLWVAYSGFNKLYNQEAGKEQLQVMLRFISDLAKERLVIVDFNKSNTIEWQIVYAKTIFEYSPEDIKEHKEFTDMYSENGFSSIAYQYLQEPLMPVSIVKCIKRLKDLSTIPYRFSEMDFRRNFYQIPGYIPREILEQHIMIKYIGGIKQFIIDCVSLRESIKYWFKSKGITDLNTEFIK